MRTFNARLVGMSFCPDYPQNLHRLETAALFAGLPHSKDPEGLPAILVREPDNEYDANAIAVHQPSAGMIGHLPRGIAAKLAPRMDAGTVYSAVIHSVVAHPDHPDRPGIDLTITERTEDEWDTPAQVLSDHAYAEIMSDVGFQQESGAPSS